MEPHSNDRPIIVYCQPDKARRPSDPPTVSYECKHCSAEAKRPVRHVHGNPGGVTSNGYSVGSRASHCGAGDYELVIGPAPVKIRRTRQPPGTPVADAELVALFS